MDGDRPIAETESTIRRRMLLFMFPVGVLLATTAGAQVRKTAPDDLGLIPFIGIWRTDISGIGQVALTITGFNAGNVEGTMKFPGQAYEFTFGQKVDRAARVGVGMVSGNVLTIDTPAGGKYQLTAAGSRLTGTYQRDSAKTPVSFAKA